MTLGSLIVSLAFFLVLQTGAVIGWFLWDRRRETKLRAEVDSRRLARSEASAARATAIATQGVGRVMELDRVKRMRDALEHKQ